MKTVKNSLSLSNLFLTLMVASMTTLMFSSCTKENIPTEKLEQTLDITGAQLPKVCPVPGLYTVTSGKINVKNEAKIKENGILSIKGSIKSNDLKLVDNDGYVYQQYSYTAKQDPEGDTIKVENVKIKIWKK
jgi:hypothetical protein